MSDIVVPFGNLKENYLQQKKAIDQAVAEVLVSGWFILGEKVAQFENAFAAYCGARFGIGVGSGTEALHLALLACGVMPGDEVITVANTCVPTLSAISFAGAKPVLVDVDPTTYTIDPERIAERITERTSVILPVHLYGQCADMDPILDLAKRHGLKIIEDCAQAHGALYRGMVAGTMGNAGAYSFYPSKNLGAYGDGGMVTTNDPLVFEKIRMLRSYGEEKRYYHTIKGFNSRLDAIQAAILLAKLPSLNDVNRKRRKIASRYTMAFRALPSIVCPIEANERHHVFHLYVIQVKEREKFQDFMREKGIATLIHYPVPIHRQTAYSECSDQEPFLNQTDRTAAEIVSLPLYPEMYDNQIDMVINAVIEWAQH